MKTYTKKARKGRLTLKNMVLSAMMAAVLCVLAPLAIPVPAAATQITLATFAVYLSAASLTTFQSVSSVFIYILLGAVGLPVPAASALLPGRPAVISSDTFFVPLLPA